MKAQIDIEKEKKLETTLKKLDGKYARFEEMNRKLQKSYAQSGNNSASAASLYQMFQVGLRAFILNSPRGSLSKHDREQIK